VEESCRGQRQMARFVFSGMVLKAEIKKEEEKKEDLSVKINL